MKMFIFAVLVETVFTNDIFLEAKSETISENHQFLFCDFMLPPPLLSAGTSRLFCVLTV